MGESVVGYVSPEPCGFCAGSSCSTCEHIEESERSYLCANCSPSGICGESHYSPDRFCRFCGRPLTPEAMVIEESRFMTRVEADKRMLEYIGKLRSMIFSLALEVDFKGLGQEATDLAESSWAGEISVDTGPQA